MVEIVVIVDASNHNPPTSVLLKGGNSTFSISMKEVEYNASPSCVVDADKVELQKDDNISVEYDDRVLVETQNTGDVDEGKHA